MLAEGRGDEGSGNKVEFIARPGSGYQVFYRFYNTSFWYRLTRDF